MRQSQAAYPTSLLALSGLLKVQRVWSNTSNAGEMPNTIERQPPRADASPPGPTATGRSRPAFHLEDSEWSRLAIGVAADAMASLGLTASADVLQLGPDSVTVYLPTSEAPPWPFLRGRLAQSWSLPRDSRIIASLPVTPAIASAARKAALVTLSEMHGRRALVDLVAVASTILKGDQPAVGVKLAEIAVELGTRRWSDLETLILVAFDQPMPRLERTRHVPDLASALEEVAVRSMNGTGSPSICVIVPPWASDPADPLLGELVRFCEQTTGVGLLCCAGAQGALCLWELAPEPAGQPTLTFGDGRRINGVDLGELAEAPVKARVPPQARDTMPMPALPALPVEVGLLGNVQVNGALESFRHRRRLTELVAFLAMHPEGTTTDTFATALWPERRVPVQTLANRLSETRRALGLASDGRPRLRKEARRHRIVEVDTDWDRFKDLAAEERGAESWRRALALVRGRPFDGLERGEWAQLEGFTAAIEASVVDLACRLGEHSLERGDAGLAHWAALQGLLASPWDERLYRLLMRAADGLGNRGGVEAALRSLAVALELEGDPLLGIHPETSALYRRLTSRSRT
jgi:DNA-binding SARP family transcriptional activator